MSHPFVIQVLAFVISACVALAIGLTTAQFALVWGVPFQVVREGPWVAWPRAQAENADPYTAAKFTREQSLMPPSGESIQFVARFDNDGEELTSACSYMINGDVPTARRWTITLYDTDGNLINNAANRYGFQNSDLLRQSGGSLSIALSRSVQPGNWLPASETDQKLVLVLRLYDSPLATEGLLTDFSLPSISRGTCI